MRLLHTADLHLDSPLRGLDRYPGAPVEAVRGATRRALENVVALAVRERVELVLIAGDVYDGDWRDYNTGLFFAAQMARLRDAGIPVVAIRGNHDAASQISRTLPLPDNVRILGEERPETLVLEDLGVAVHGQGFATRAVTHDLSAGYPDPVPGALNVALLHTSADGRPGHDPYAPCSPAALARRGYDYWALGHVHAREVLAREPYVVYPGNPQGRHARETGPRGVALVDVRDGRVTGVSHVDVDVLRWAVLRVDATQAGDEDDLFEQAREAVRAAVDTAAGRPVCARFELSGPTALHARLAGDPERLLGALRSVATDAGGGGVWVETVRLAARPVSSLRDPTDEALAPLLDALDPDALDDDELRALVGDVGGLRARLPSELREGPDGLALDDPATLRRLLADAEALLRARLLEGSAP